MATIIGPDWHRNGSPMVTIRRQSASSKQTAFAFNSSLARAFHIDHPRVIVELDEAKKTISFLPTHEDIHRNQLTYRLRPDGKASVPGRVIWIRTSAVASIPPGVYPVNPGKGGRIVVHYGKGKA